MIKYLILFLVYLHLVQSTSEDINSTSLEPDLDRNVITEDRLSFERYHSYGKIVNYLQKLQRTKARVSKLISIGKSFEKRKINAMYISNTNFKSNDLIIVDAGWHGREWSATASALYLIGKMLLTPLNRRMYKNFDWVIIPTANPDGYQYCRKKDRSWRKTTSVGKFCFGVDANRNFGYKWGKKVAKKKQCEKTYKGPMPFSESETRAMRDWLKTLKPKIRLYISLHAKGRFISHPWSWSKKSVKNKNELVRVANIAAAAMKKINGVTFKVGSSAHMLGKSTGNSMDYFYKKVGVKYCFGIPASLQSYKVPEEKLEKRVGEAFAGIKALWQEMDKVYHSKKDESIEID